MDKITALKKTELFGALSAGELKALSGACSERKLRKGETLFTAGEEAKGLYVIAKGALRAYRENTEGREQIIHVEKAGTTIAEVPVFDDKPYPSTVVAEEDSEILFITKQDVRVFCLKYPAIGLAALKLLATRLRKTAALAESLSLWQVDQRLAAFLCQEAQDRQTARFSLPTNSVLASRLGSVREVVSRAFTRLEKAGYVKVDKGRTVSLLDRMALEKIADL